MRINHNIAALNTHRQLSGNNSAVGKSLEKLSSGLRINRAGDDAAGLAISEKMRGQIRGLDQAQRNAQDGISLIQTAEGALNETHSILQRMRELAVQSSNDTNTDADRKELQKEVDQLVKELDRIANTTEFNTQKLLNGNLSGTNNAAQVAKFDEVSNSAVFTGITNAGTITNDLSYNIRIGSANTSATTFTVTFTDHQGNASSLQIGAAGGTVTIGQASVTIGGLTTANIGDEATFTQRAAIVDNTDTSLTFQIGANSSQTMNVSIEDMGAAALNVNGIKIDTKGAAEASISAIQKALDDVSSQRSKLGAFQNRLEHSINNLGASSENLTAAESRIRDVDMAKEMMDFTKNNILTQAAQAMLAQANQTPQGVLQLLR
ncbi:MULTISPECIES: flagellin [Paenibacillus]|uniref:flagellin N-terminal helical domain-containing protein n=1 Tax=Paenibacillus TaxID=44249 RepID=UPI0006D25C25|nr:MULTISPECIES: flagellin [Paenibacillus]GCL73679.1 flagellin [Paenibacillus naphthalenovorans]SDJ12662.1 flagellin [Paenibacillus naphthalenovorans]